MCQMKWEYADRVCVKSNLASGCSKNCDECPVPLIAERLVAEFDRYLVRALFGKEAVHELFEEENNHETAKFI